jgi:hypothetical protein
MHNNRALLKATDILVSIVKEGNPVIPPRNKVARNRWRLAYTLIKNPGVVKYRTIPVEGTKLVRG